MLQKLRSLVTYPNQIFLYISTCTELLTKELKKEVLHFITFGAGHQKRSAILK